MSNQRGKKSSTILGQCNVKRCFYCACVSVVVLPVILLLSVFLPETVEYYQLPGAFFAVVSAAFAYLFYQLLTRKAKRYYDGVVWVYLLVFQLFLVYFAGQNLIFYYAAVLVSAYIAILSTGQYTVLALAELSCYAGLVVKNGTGEQGILQLLLLLAVHLFAFVLSRDFYITKKNHIIEEKKLRREMQLSEQDALTGLLNRRGLERQVAELWPVCVSRQETVAVLLLEIDSFKSFNDQCGHAQGDVCIRRIVSVLEEQAQGNGIVARVGGAEFLLFVYGMEIQQIYDMAELIREKVECLQISGRSADMPPITVSIGIDVRYAAEDVSVQGLYGRAADGLYEAKQDGRNCVRSAHMMRERRSRIG